MDPLGLVKLTSLMQRTSGSAEVTVGLIDGPVATHHPDLVGEHVRDIRGPRGPTCQADSTACLHGTFVAGILFARRTSSAPAICPGCTLVVRSIFADGTTGRVPMPSATPNELAAAILDCIDAGARVINLSLGLAHCGYQKGRSCWCG
jgi:subtilisin family serine protease